jgi:RNA polymerase sigma-70 factor (ECF subfamily)
MLTPLEFSSAYENAFRLTRGLLLSRGIGSTLADELAQAAWARAWERRCQLRQPDRLIAWVSSIALNLLRNEMKRHNNILPLTEFRSSTAAAPGEWTDAISKIDAERAIGALSQADRQMLVSSVIGGLTSRENAACSRLSPGAVRVRLHRAKRMLRERGRELRAGTTAQRAA